MADGSVKQIGLKMTLEASSVKTEAQATAQALNSMAAQATTAANRAAQDLGKIEMSSKQTAMAMRQLPMQMTDIVVGLSSGQSPFMVLMQQGGQLKDSFGGVGAAVRAVGGHVAGMINPVTLAAGAVGALALAAYQGSREHAEHANALIMSGNAAGVTAGQLADMARTLAEGTHTQMAAAAAVNEMARSSGLGGQELQRYTGIALDWERVTGQAVSETADKFRALQEEPLRASLELNKGVNYLTASTYEHIKALMEQGQHVDAARVATNAYADAVATRTTQVSQNLGLMERGWHAVRSAAKWAWDEMAGIGRPQTVSEQLDAARKKLEAAQRDAASGMPGSFGAFQAGQAPDGSARVEKLRQEIALLSEQERMLRRSAEVQAESNRLDQAKIKWSQDSDKYLSKQALMEREITRARNEGAAAGIEQAVIEQRIAAIRERNADKGGRSAALKAERAEARELAKDLRAVAESAGLAPGFYEDWNRLNALHAKGKMSTEELTAAQAKLLAQQPVIKAAEEERRKETEALVKVEAALREERLKAAAAAEQQAAQLADGNQRLREEIDQIGMSKAQQVEYARAKLDSAIATKEEELALAQKQFTNTREAAAIEEQIRLLRERQGLLGRKLEKDEMLDAQRAQLDLWKSIDKTAHDVFVNVFEDGAGTFKRLGQTLKASLLDLLYQLTLKRWIINIGASITGIDAGIIGQALGGGGGSNPLGMASNANSAYGAASLAANWLGYGSGAAGGTVTAANAVSYLGGDGLGTLIGLNGGWGTTGAGGAASASGFSAAGLGVVAAPLIIGALLERFGHSNDNMRLTGAAYSTGTGKDPKPGSTGEAYYDVLTGALPDRQALLDKLVGWGGDAEALSKFNDRTLYRMMAGARGYVRDDGTLYQDERGIPWQQFYDNLQQQDFYRGPGYTNPEAEGWWSNDQFYGVGNMDQLGVDPQMVEASRQLADSLVKPFVNFADTFKLDDTFRAAVGMAWDPDKPDRLWGGLNIQRNGESLTNWPDKRVYENQQEWARDMFGSTLEAFGKLDLPEWARKQVDGAREQIGKLEGENMGQEAATIFEQTTAGVTALIKDIQTLIDVFPDFSDATQDSVFALQELMGGMDQLQGAYSAYVQNYWSEAERADAARAQLSLALGEVGLSLPATRDAFRDLVEAQDLSTEEGRKAFAALMGVADAFAQLTPPAEDLLKLFGHLPDFIGLTADAIAALVNEVGGVDALRSQYDQYLGNYYSDTERDDITRRWIEGEMAGLGMAMPTTREGFRALVDSLDLTTEEGRKAFEMLMRVSGAFADVTDSAEAAAAAAQDAARKRTDEVWDKLNQLFDEQIGNWQQLADEARGIFEMARDAATGLRGNVDSTRVADAAAASAFIDQALAAARASGALPESEDLRQAIDAARGGITQDDYASVADYEVAQLMLAGKLEELGGVAEAQKSFAEQQVDQLKEQQKYWQDQIALLRETGITIGSIDEGVQFLADALRAEQDAAAAAAAGGGAGGTGTGGGGGGGGSGEFGGGTGGGGAPISVTWDEANNRLVFGDGGYIDYTTGLRHYPDGSVGTTPEDPWNLDLWKKRALGVPGYAAGGLHTGGLRLVGERGPELEFTGPARYWSFDQSQRMLGGSANNAELLAELRTAREETAAANRRANELLAKVADLLDRVTAGGNAMMTETL